MKKPVEEVKYHSRPNGNSVYDVKCPFCGTEFEIQAWSKHKGKKCPKCANLVVCTAGQGFFGVM